MRSIVRSVPRPLDSSDEDEVDSSTTDHGTKQSEEEAALKKISGNLRLIGGKARSHRRRRSVFAKRRKSSFEVVNAATGMKLRYVEDADYRKWKTNTLRVELMAVSFLVGFAKSHHLHSRKDSKRLCFVEFELEEKWYNRTLPDGTTILWGQKGKICRSCEVSYDDDVVFQDESRAFMSKSANTFRFHVRIPDSEITLRVCEKSGSVIRVVGQTKINVMDIVQRDLNQIVPHDLAFTNKFEAEIFRMYHPKNEQQDVGTMTLKVAYTERWGALCLNMEPHFLPFETNPDTAVTAEIKRFQANITRIQIAWNGIKEFMKTLDELFGWWDVGKSVLVVAIGLYIIWMVPESYTVAIFPWLLVWHILHQRKLRRAAAGTNEYDKHLLKFDVANHADAKIRLSVIAAHGLPLTDSFAHGGGVKGDLAHSSVSVVPENPFDEMSKLWCDALKRVAELEGKSEDLLAEAKKFIDEFGRQDYMKLKTALIEKYGEVLYESCKSRVQALLVDEEMANNKVGQWIQIRESTKYRSIFASKPKKKRVWCIVKDFQLGWGERMNDDIRKTQFRCDLVSMSIDQKTKGDHRVYMIESKPGAASPFCYWLFFDSNAQGKDTFLKIMEAKSKSGTAQRQSEYLNKKLIEKIESELLSGEFYKLGTRRWKKRKVTLSDTTLVYESSSWFSSKKIKIIPTHEIERVVYREADDLPSMGLTFSDSFYQSSEAILHFVRTKAAQKEAGSSTDLVFFFEKSSVATKWKRRMESILGENRRTAASTSDRSGEESKNSSSDDASVAARVLNKKLYDPELATKMIDDCSQGRLAFLERDGDDEASMFVKIFFAGVFCWYMDVTFVRHSNRKFFYPSHNPDSALIGASNRRGTFRGIEFCQHLKHLNSQVRDVHLHKLQDYLIKNNLLIHVTGRLSLLHEESYWQFNINGNPMLANKFIRTKFVEDELAIDCSPDVFVSVHLDRGVRAASVGENAAKSKSLYVGRTNTEYRNTSPEFGTNVNKPLARGRIDALLAFARKSRNKLFRVNQEMEILKWEAKMKNGMGVRQWYWAFEFSTARPTLAIKQQQISRRSSRRGTTMRSAMSRKFTKFASSYSSEFSFDDEDGVDDDSTAGGGGTSTKRSSIPRLKCSVVLTDSGDIAAPPLSSISPPSSPGFGLYSPRIDEAVADEYLRISAAPDLPAPPLKRKEHGELLPWTECKDHLVFKIWDEDFSVEEGFGDDRIGICRVPLLDFIPHPNNEGVKGRQPDIWRWIPVEISEVQRERKKKLGMATGKDGGAWLLVRVQVLLRQGEKEVNFEDSKSGFLYMYNRTIAVIKNINDFLENAVITYEKLKNLLNWTHPRKTRAALIIIVILAIATMGLPLKLLVMGLFVFPFTGIFRPPGGLMWMSEHVISSIPDDVAKRKLLEKPVPLPVTALPRANYLPGVVCSGCVRHASIRVAGDTSSSLDDVQWNLNFVALTPEGWIFWWHSREDARKALQDAIAKSEIEGVKTLTSYEHFLANPADDLSASPQMKARRSSTVLGLELFDDSPMLHARAWRALAKAARDSSKSDELNAMISGSFFVRGAHLSDCAEIMRPDRGFLSVEKDGHKHAFAFRDEGDRQRWRGRLGLFCGSD
eukprot:g140.t1